MTKFILKSNEKTGSDIELKDMIPIVIGRSPLTKITNTRVSRKHLKFTANLSKSQVHVENIGQNSSKINGSKALKKNQSTVLKPGDKIEILEGLFEHELIREGKKTMESVIPRPQPNIHPNHWSQGLYASMNDKEMIVFENETISIIRDRYPKSQKHFLVLPKEKITTLYELNESHIDLVKEMLSFAETEIIQKDDKSVFKSGFHAIPSMAQVHMHVISQDFDSLCLKNKKHWNSFNTEYFIPSEKVLKSLKENGKISAEQSDKKDLLSRDLKCNQCDFVPKNMPKLKEHLKGHLN